jgi:hypothetical protein
MAKAKQKGKPKDPLRVARGKLGQALKEVGELREMFSAKVLQCKHLLTDVERLRLRNSIDLKVRDVARNAKERALIEMRHWKARAVTAEAENVQLRIEAAGELRCVFDLGAKPDLTWEPWELPLPCPGGIVKSIERCGGGMAPDYDVLELTSGHVLEVGPEGVNVYASWLTFNVGAGSLHRYDFPIRGEPVKLPTPTWGVSRLRAIESYQIS